MSSRAMERLGGWALLGGGTIFLVNMAAPQLNKWKGIAGLLVALGAGAWVLGHLV